MYPAYRPGQVLAPSPNMQGPVYPGRGPQDTFDPYQTQTPTNSFEIQAQPELFQETPQPQVNENLRREGITPFNPNPAQPNTDVGPAKDYGIKMPPIQGIPFEISGPSAPPTNTPNTVSSNAGDANRSFTNQVIDYTPETTGINAMNELMQTMPTRGQYKPSLMRKIFGGIAAGAGGGVPAWEYITQGPYREARGDWESKFDVASKLAGQERGANAIERQFISSVLQNDTAAKKLEETTRYNTGRLDQGQQRIDNETARIALTRAKQEKPNLEFAQTRDGMVYSVDKASGEIKMLMDPTTGQPLLGDKLTANDKLEYAMTMLDAAQSNRIAMEAIRQANRVSLQASGQEDALERILEREKAGGDSAVKALEIQRTRFNNAQAALAEHPEWNDWITLADPTNNTFSIRPPSNTNFFWQDSNIEEQRKIYNQIVERIFGKAIAGQLTGSATTPQTDTKPTESGTVRVQGPPGPDGKPQTGTVPRKNLSTLPKGWKVIE